MVDEKDFLAFTKDDVVDYAEAYDLDEGFGKGPSILMPDGTVYDLSSAFETHFGFFEVVFKGLYDSILDEYPGDTDVEYEGYLAYDQEKIMNHAESDLGIITLNVGLTYKEPRAKVVILSKPTEAQYGALTDFLDYVQQKGKKSVLFFMGDKIDYVEYQFGEDQGTDEIIDKVRRYFATGKIVEAQSVDGVSYDDVIKAIEGSGLFPITADADETGFILPDGRFLNTADNDYGMPWHMAVEDFLGDKGLANEKARERSAENDSGDGSPTIEAFGAIRVSDGEEYICLPPVRPTEQAFSALEGWLDKMHDEHSLQRVYACNYEGNQDAFYDIVPGEEKEIVGKLRRYYSSGRLLEHAELTEAKDDELKFKDWLDSAYEDVGYQWSEPMSDVSYEMRSADSCFDEFQDYRRRNKGKQTDYYYWMGQEPLMFFSFLARNIRKKSGKANVKKEVQAGAESVYDGKFWRVYKINTYEASCHYGKGTTWCITDYDRIYWDKYEDEGIEFYFLLPKDGKKYMKYAVGIDKAGYAQLIFDQEDCNVDGIPNVPNIPELSDVKNAIGMNFHAYFNMGEDATLDNFKDAWYAGIDWPSILWFLSEDEEEIKRIMHDDLDIDDIEVVESLTEAKTDQDAFVDKFGQDLFDLFQKSKDRLKNAKVSTDMTWHVKNTDPKDMKQMLYNLRSKSVKTDGEGKADLTKIPGKYKYLGSKGGYDVYEPLDVDASMALGVGSGWCTTGRYGHAGDLNFKPSREDAEEHWDEYTSKGVRFFYFLRDGVAKYAIALYPWTRPIDYWLGDDFVRETNVEVFNQEDKKDYGAMKSMPLELLDVDVIFDVDKTKGDLVLSEDGSTVLQANRNAVSITIPSTVTSIYDFAFSRCSYLASVVIPSSVASIGDSAFIGCSSLPSVTIPSSVTSIGDDAFFGCSSLEFVTIGNKDCKIGDSVFPETTKIIYAETESLNEEEKSKEDVFYILPDGSERHAKDHHDIDLELDDIEDDGFSKTAKSWVRVRINSFVNSITLPNDDVTDEQFDATISALERIDGENSKVELNTYDGKWIVTFDLGKHTPEEVMMEYMLREGLNESNDVDSFREKSIIVLREDLSMQHSKKELRAMIDCLNEAELNERIDELKAKVLRMVESDNSDYSDDAFMLNYARMVRARDYRPETLKDGSWMYGE